MKGAVAIADSIQILINSLGKYDKNEAKKEYLIM